MVPKTLSGDVGWVVQQSTTGLQSLLLNLARGQGKEKRGRGATGKTVARKQNTASQWVSFHSTETCR